jgi:hypothetical protein
VAFAAYDETISPLHDALNHSFEYDSEVPKPRRVRCYLQLSTTWAGRLHHLSGAKENMCSHEREKHVGHGDINSKFGACVAPMCRVGTILPGTADML